MNDGIAMITVIVTAARVDIKSGVIMKIPPNENPTSLNPIR